MQNHAALLAEFRAFMADPLAPNLSPAHYRAAVTQRGIEAPAGPRAWGLWHIADGSSTAFLCEFDGACCFECYLTHASAERAAKSLNASGYASGRYVVALIPAGIAYNATGSEFSATGCDTPWQAGMEGGYLTCFARLADLATLDKVCPREAFRVWYGAVRKWNRENGVQPYAVHGNDTLGLVHRSGSLCPEFDGLHRIVRPVSAHVLGFVTLDDARNAAKGYRRYAIGRARWYRLCGSHGICPIPA